MEIFLFFLFFNLFMCFKFENIHNFNIKNFILSKTEFIKSFYFHPKITDNLEHEIFLQIKTTNNNGNINLCSGFFSNKSEENIYYDYINNNIINCQKKFNAYITNYEEFNITIDQNNSRMINNGYFYIAVYIDRQIGTDFSGSIMPIITNTNITINSELGAKSYTFKNNYKNKTFSFVVYSNRLLKSYMHIQLALYNNDNFLNLTIFDNSRNIIDLKNSINSYNNFLDSTFDKNNYYLIVITFLKENDEMEKKDFAIYFEYTSFNNIINLTNTIYEFNFLTKGDYYFLQDLNNFQEQNLFYIINDSSGKRGIISLSYSRLNNSNLGDNMEIELLSLKYVNSKSKIFANYITIFNYKNEIKSDKENILILKLSSFGLSTLKIQKIQFKILKKIILQEENEFNHFSFNSNLNFDNFGYFYIPKMKNETKRQLIYCSQSNTMNIYNGDYNIVESFSGNQNYEISRLYKYSHQKENNSYFNEQGITIISFNKENKYFIQIIDVSIDFYNNLLIDKISDKSKINREIEFNVPTMNYYIFCENDFSDEYSDNYILDVKIIYGYLNIEIIDIDEISDTDFKLNKIILFKKEDYSIINANHPILIRRTTELIKITNNNYYLKYLNKAKFYLNRYIIKNDQKLYGSLIPIYFNPLESKLFGLNNVFGITKYIFKLGDNYYDYVSFSNETIIQIALGNNNINEIHNISNKNNFINKNDSYINFGDFIKFTNYLNKSILLWSYLGIDESIQESVVSVYLSNNYYYLYKFNMGQKLVFDWYKIRNKINNGLIPQKIEISLLNEYSTKALGYFYQKLSFEDDHDDSYLLYYTHINSITYELEQGQYHTFLSEDINITAYDYYYGKKIINYMIYPQSGLATILFYIEYLYDISDYLNELKYLQFDNSIYSLNLKPNINKFEIQNSSINQKQYLVFQVLNCGFRDFQKEVKISFRLGNITLESDNIIIQKISYCNTIGYIKLDNNIRDNFYINILKPFQFYIIYYYISNFEDIYSFQSNYNINIEKEQNSKAKIFIVSFDCFLKNIKTNYTILILNRKEIKKIISTECEFLSSIENMNNSKKYISFVDNNENGRIKKDITFEDFGNYEIFIMAQSLESLAIYKFLGSETYSFNDGFQQKETDNYEENSFDITFLIVIILFLLFIMLIIFFIVFRYKKKKKLISLFNSMNESMLFSNIYNDQQDSNNADELSTLNSLNNNTNDKEVELVEKPKFIDDNQYNEYEEDIEPNPDLLSQPPAPILGNTFFSDEDRIRYELKKLNESSSNKNNENNNEEKKYVNTNMGEG